GRLAKAFLATQPPSSRRSLEGLDEATLRERLEQQFNAAAGPNAAGPWSSFTQAPYVRLLAGSGPGTTPRPRSPGRPALDHKVHRVTLLYDVKLDVGEGQLQVVLEGTEAQGSAGRQWSIDPRRTGSLQTTFQPTEKGRRVMAAGQSAGPFVRGWA